MKAKSKSYVTSAKTMYAALTILSKNGGAMMKNINSICIKQFQERYGNMTPRDWERLIYGYIRKVTNRPDLKEDEVFIYVA